MGVKVLRFKITSMDSDRATAAPDSDHGNFGFPAPVMATIISFTAHPEEPQFQDLRNLNPTVRKAVDASPTFFSRDRLLLLEGGRPSLDGAWYFAGVKTTHLELPELPPQVANLMPAEELADMKRRIADAMGDPRCYQFQREDKYRYLQTASVDQTRIDPANQSPGAKTFSLMLTSEPPEPGVRPDPDTHLGYLMSTGTPMTHDQWYTIKKDLGQTGTADIPSPNLEDFPNMQEFLLAMQTRGHRMIQRLAELNPEHAPETIPEDYLGWNAVLVELQRHNQARQEPQSIRLMVAWPRNRGAEL